VWRYQLLGSRHYTLDAMGRVAEAAAALADMEALAESLDHDGMRGDLCTARMLLADRECRADEAERLALRAIELGERGQWPAAVTLGHGEIAWLATLRQDHERAQHHVTEGIAWARQTAKLGYREGGSGRYEMQLRSIGIESLLLQARWHEAAVAAREALEHLPPDRPHDRFNMRQRLARGLLGMGAIDEALEATRQAMEDATLADKPGLVASAQSMLAHVCWTLGRLDEAMAHAREAEGRARAVENLPIVSMALRHRGEVHALREELAEARACWVEAERHLTAMEATADLNEVRTDLARLDAMSGSTQAAHAAVVALLWPSVAPEPTAPPSPRPLPDPDLDDIAITNDGLMSALTVLEAAADRVRADAVRTELRSRLQATLARLPDASTRHRLVQAFAHWRLVAQAWPDAVARWVQGTAAS
jgi:tetratricopeptide (TPR) repeat protein